MVVGSSDLRFAPASQLAEMPRISTMTLDIEPFDLEQTLDGGQAFRWHLIGEGSYCGALESRVVQIASDGRRVVVSCDTDESQDETRERAEDYLQAGIDVCEVRRVLGSEPGFGESVTESPLVRVMRQEPWECLAAFICSQNSNIPRIKQMVAAVARLGRRIGEDEWAYEFPEPRVVADAGEAYLRSVGLGYRAKHLSLTAQVVAGWGDGAFARLRTASYSDAKDALMELQGVGPKVADCVLAYSLDKGEAFPVDVHVRRAAIRLYGLDEDIKNGMVGEWARDRFGKYAAWAQLYMFRDEINRRLTGQ